MLELFAGELRRLRATAGLSQEALSERINYSASLVAAVEQCRRPPRLEFTERSDRVLDADGLLLRIRETMIRESVMPWFREWVTIEQEATALRSFQPLGAPRPAPDRGLCPRPLYRDSKDPTGPVLVVAPAAWRSFVTFAKAH